MSRWQRDSNRIAMQVVVAKHLLSVFVTAGLMMHFQKEEEEGLSSIVGQLGFTWKEGLISRKRIYVIVLLF